MKAFIHLKYIAMCNLSRNMRRPNHSRYRTTTILNRAWAKSIQQRGSHNECTCRVWHQSDNQLGRKYAETLCKITGEEMAGGLSGCRSFSTNRNPVLSHSDVSRRIPLTGTVNTDIASLLWRYKGRGSVPNPQPHDYLLNRLFRRRSNKTSKLRVTGLCVGNSPGTSEFPAQMASNAKNVSIWWRHHGLRRPRMLQSKFGCGWTVSRVWITGSTVWNDTCGYLHWKSCTTR